MKHILLPFIAGIVTMSVCAATDASGSSVPPLQQADSGTIERRYIYSPQLQENWPIDVWLPNGYSSDVDTRYPVIYMHDGQNLFDAKTTWNHQAWEMDSITSSLIDRNLIKAPIIVGVHSHADTRKGDLMPQKAVMEAGIPKQQVDSLMGGIPIRGDAYAQFLVETLKPQIDSLYRTLPDAPNTTVMGSSMGGLMSIYAMCEYPEVFGNAICMSTHWIGRPEQAEIFANAMYRYLDNSLPRDGRHRLYLDHGTETLDSLYGPWEEMMISLIKTRGFDTPSTLKTHIAHGAAHTETSWAERVHIPMIFILGNIQK